MNPQNPKFDKGTKRYYDCRPNVELKNATLDLIKSFSKTAENHIHPTFQTADRMDIYLFRHINYMRSVFCEGKYLVFAA